MFFPILIIVIIFVVICNANKKKETESKDNKNNNETLNDYIRFSADTNNQNNNKFSEVKVNPDTNKSKVQIDIQELKTENTTNIDNNESEEYLDILKDVKIKTQMTVSSFPKDEEKLENNFDFSTRIDKNNNSNGITILNSKQFTTLTSYLYDDISQIREINKIYQTNKLSISNEKFIYTKDISDSFFQGKINISLEDQIIALNIKILNPESQILKKFYYDKNDDVNLSLILDFNNKLVDFYISRIRTNMNNTKEIGNYLYNYPDLKILKFGLSQCSYLEATKITNHFISYIKSILGDLNILFS